MRAKESLKDKLSRGLEEAYVKMVKFKRYKNTPIVISKDGKIVKINPNDIKLEGDK